MLRWLERKFAVSRSRHALAAAWTLSLALAGAHAVAEDHAGRTDHAIASAQFDIPSQPLEDALMSYAAATGVEVFVDHALAAGQKSAALQGTYTFEGALRRLLQSTGLVICRVAEQGYTLVAPPAQEPPIGRMPDWSADPAHSSFFAALQFVLKQALCASPEVAPGQYRAALAIWIKPSGEIANARVLGADAQDQAARNLAARVIDVSVGEAPPPGLKQPVTFVILPSSPERSGDCHAQ